MLLSDIDILDSYERGLIECNPFDALNVQPCSLDLRLGRNLLHPKSSTKPIGFIVGGSGQIQVADDINYREYDLDNYCFTLSPGSFVLGSTLERVGCPGNTLACQVADKSTLARLGISVCFSAGWIDPGNVLNITLEIYNHSQRAIELRSGMAICQLKFFELKTPSKNLYSGKYLNSVDTEGAV